MADDNNVIVYLLPHSPMSQSVIENASNRSKYVPPRLASPEVAFSVDDDDLFVPRLRLPFGSPRYRQGLVLGTSLDCDIVLPANKGISSRHGAISFDDENRPVYRDLHSLSGSRVTYNDNTKEIRKGFQWILGGHEIPDRREIVLYFCGSISFRVVVCSYDRSSAQYLDAVRLFREATEDVASELGRVDIGRPGTEPGSRAETPGVGPLYVKTRVGEGAFASVNRLWDVSTGLDMAVKKPSRSAIRAKRVKEDAWRNECRIISRLTHENIVALLSSDFSVVGCPQLYLEYVPCGSLSKHIGSLTTGEHVQVAVQCLSALAYMHGQVPHPVVHRDIKPDNILVQDRFDGHIHVKLADFGLTKDSRDLTTLCGTPLYLAPEIYKEADRRGGRGGPKRVFTPAVDIWSLGVVLGDCAYGLPECTSDMANLRWCRELCETFARKTREEHPGSLLAGLIQAMVVMKAELREAAASLYERAIPLLGAVEGEVDGAYEVDEYADGAGAGEYSTMPPGMTALYDDVDRGVAVPVSVPEAAPGSGPAWERSGAPSAESVRGTKRRVASSSPSSSGKPSSSPSSSSGRRSHGTSRPSGREPRPRRHRRRREGSAEDEHAPAEYDPRYRLAPLAEGEEGGSHTRGSGGRGAAGAHHGDMAAARLLMALRGE